MIIDFISLDSKLSIIFEAQKCEVLTEYEKISEDLLRRGTSLAWLVSNPTSRNVFHSKLFYYLRCLHLVNYVDASYGIDKIVTDDVNLYKILANRYPVGCVGTSKRSSGWIQLLRVLKWVYGAIRCKSKERIKTLLEKKQVTIIDTDIAKFATKYNDRYYGDILDRLPKEIQESAFYNIIYLPNPKKNDINVIDNNTKFNTLYLWDFLKPVDYLSSFRSLLDYKQRNLSYIFEGYDIKNLIKAVYHHNKSFYFYCAFLYERMIYRMKEMRVDIRLYIDWYENQSIDRAFHWAMNKYYPNVRTHSYLGFMGDANETPHIIATNTELESGLAPKVLFVCNHALKDKYKTSGYKGTVKIAPFFRASSVWNLKMEPFQNDEFTILAPMGLSRVEVVEKVNFFVDVLNQCHKFNFRVLLKPHPVYNSIEIEESIKGTSNIEIVGGSIYKYLPKVDAVVASNSTTTYEALAVGKPLLYFVGRNRTLTLSRPPMTPDNMWFYVEDLQTFEESIKSIQSLEQNLLFEQSKVLREYFFTQETIGLNKELFDIK